MKVLHRLRTNLSRKLNNKGMTLVEVMITLTIISIMAVPIFDTFLESMRINQKTVNAVEANHIGQMFLEQLRAGKEFEAFEDEDGNQVLRASMSGYDVRATLKAIDVTYKPSMESKVNLGNITDLTNFPIKVVYQKGEAEDAKTYVTYGGNNYEATAFKMVFESSNENITQVSLYKVEESSETQMGVTKNITATDDEIDVSITVSGKPQNGSVEVINNSKETVKLYEVDDFDKLLKIKANSLSTGVIKIYTNKRSKPASGKNELKVYDVDIEISKNGKVLERLVSTVKK